MRGGGCFLTVDLSFSADTGAHSSVEAVRAGAEAVIETLAAGPGDRRATVFATADFARIGAPVVFGLSARGHEVAAHGGRVEASLVANRTGYAAAVMDAVQAIEDAAGQRIVGYRTAEPPPRPGLIDALQALADCGIAYDSSLVGRAPRAASAPFDAYALVGGAICAFPLYRTTLPGGFGVRAVGPAAFRRLPAPAILRLMREAALAGYVPVLALAADRITERHRAKLATILEFFPNRGPMAETVPGVGSVAALRRAALKLVA